MAAIRVEAGIGMPAGQNITRAHYSQEDLVNAIRAVGVRPGNIVFSHVGMGFLGRPEAGGSEEIMYQTIRDAFAEVLGPDGTLLIPTYSYSFCNHQPYNPLETASAVGYFTEMFRREPGVVRSSDPIFSVAGLGPRAKELFSELPPDCFGEDCLYHRLRLAGAKICNIGVGFRYATFIHHAEQSAGAPYRFRKLFTGAIQGDGPERKEGWIYYVRVLGNNSMPDLRRLEAAAKSQGKCLWADVGRGQVTCVDCSDMFDLCMQGIAQDPWYLATGPAEDPLELEKNRVPPRQIKVELGPGSSMMEIVQRIAPLPRDIISDGFDAALKALGNVLPLKIHTYHSGTQCWTWLVPEKWTCREARLETLSGKTVFSYSDCPLHVVSYSLPFDDEISRAELFKHLHTHSGLENAIPFKFKYYDRDWGLCCSKRTRESLTDDSYRIFIDSEFSYGELKVGEMVLPGESQNSFVLCAHLCHPFAANDGLSGVAAGIEVMRRLQDWPNRRYTYRLLLLPETVGSAAYLSHHEELIPTMVGGLFLEMLGLNHPHALQLSWQGNTAIDHISSQALKEKDSDSWSGPFRQVVWNDETQFNAPGVRVPMLSLSRVLPIEGNPNKFYPEYHTNLDNAGLVSPSRMEESVETIMHMLSRLEKDLVPVNAFRGEIFCSRYGLHVDGYNQPQAAAKFFQVMFLIDGKRSISQIAQEVGSSFSETYELVERFHQVGLVDLGVLSRSGSCEAGR